MSISTSQTPSGRTPEQDAVICALIALARATEAKEIPAGTAPVLFASLAATMPGNTLSASAANDHHLADTRAESHPSPPTVPPARLPVDGLRTFCRRT